MTGKWLKIARRNLRRKLPQTKSNRARPTPKSPPRINSASIKSQRVDLQTKKSRKYRRSIGSQGWNERDEETHGEIDVDWGGGSSAFFDEWVCFQDWLAGERL